MTEGFWSKHPKVPLLVSLDENSTFKFNHPLYNTTYTMNIPEIVDAEIRSSKFGWLLMSKGKAMFFFNPFTKEKIDLPDLSDNYDFNGIGFSSPPTSPECMILAMVERACSVTEYYFIRHGKNTWNAFRDNNNYKFLPSFNNPVFHEGVFYVLGEEGNLVIYNPKEDCCTVITSPDTEPCSSIKISYLAKCKDDIVAVFEGHVGKFVKIFKFDNSKKVWRQQSSLGDNMLFLSMTASFATTTNEDAKALGMGNKIYTPRFDKKNKNFVFYSPVTSKFDTFWGDFARGDCHNTTEKVHCTWIEPNLEEHSSEELRWH